MSRGEESKEIVVTEEQSSKVRYPWGTALYSFIGVIFCLYLRKPSSFHLPQFWAEDGLVFFKESIELGLRSITTPYAGYYHLYPRVWALLTRLIDPLYSPLLFEVGAIVAHGLVVCMLFSPRVSLPYKPLLALLTVVVPATPEVLLILTNAQWVLALGFILILIAESPTTPWGQRREYVFLSLISLTGPFSPIFLPLFLLKAYIERTSRTKVFLVLLLLCCIIQTSHLDSIIVASQKERSISHFLFVISDYLRYAFLGYFVENDGVLRLEEYLLLGVAALLISVQLWEFSRTRCSTGCWILGGSLLTTAAVILKFKSHPSLLIGGSRYFYIPTVLLAWSFLVYVSLKRYKVLYLTPLFAVVVHFAFSDAFSVKPLKDKRWRRQVRCIRAEQECHIPINPDGWSIYLPAKKKNLS